MRRKQRVQLASRKSAALTEAVSIEPGAVPSPKWARSVVSPCLKSLLPGR